MDNRPISDSNIEESSNSITDSDNNANNPDNMVSLSDAVDIVKQGILPCPSCGLSSINGRMCEACRRKQPGYKLGGMNGKGWLPGESGNYKGTRGKRKRLTNILLDYLEEPTDKNDPTSPKRIQALAAHLIAEAFGGDIKYLKEILDRIDPKPKRIEISTIHNDEDLPTVEKLQKMLESVGTTPTNDDGGEDDNKDEDNE